MKKIKWLFLGVIGILIALILVRDSMKGIPVSAGKAREGNISEYVEERAKTTLPRTWKICMPMNGRIMPIMLQPGEKVKQKQELARMDTSLLEASLAEASAHCEALQGEISINKFNQLEETALRESQEWIQIMNQLESISEKWVEASRSAAKYTDEHRDTLVASGQAVSKISVSKAEMESAVANVKVASDELTHGVFQLISTIFSLGPKYISEYLSRKQLEGKVLNSRLAASQAAEAEAVHNLKLAVMTSPIDGVVLNRFFDNERVLSAGEPLLEIGDLGELQVTAEILSDEATAIKPGDKVGIYGAVFESREVPGTVQRVNPKGFTKISSLGVEQQRVKVVIDFDKTALTEILNSGQTLGVDFRVHVRIITENSQNALIIPRTALFKGESGSWKLFKIENGKAIITDVKIGLINDCEAEIISGLAKDDLIVSAPPTSLNSGNRISIHR